MKFLSFKFLTGENIQSAVVKYLKQLNLNILGVNESGLNGSEDTFLLHLAYTQQRVVLTHDSDFGTLAFAKQQPIFGIVYLKPGHIDPQCTIAPLNAILELENLKPPFIITAKNTDDSIKIRVRFL